MPGSSNLDNYTQHHPTQHFHATPVLLLGCGEGALNTRGSQFHSLFGRVNVSPHHYMTQDSP